jgi:predicted transcriptional regulator
MRDQRSSVSQDEQRVDVAVLGLLLATDRMWSVDEVSREIGDPLEAADSIARLYGAGVVHRLQEFVFATRAAMEAARLSQT